MAFDRIRAGLGDADDCRVALPEIPEVCRFVFPETPEICRALFPEFAEVWRDGDWFTSFEDRDGLSSPCADDPLSVRDRLFVVAPGVDGKIRLYNRWARICCVSARRCM